MGSGLVSHYICRYVGIYRNVGIHIMFVDNCFRDRLTFSNIRGR